MGHAVFRASLWVTFLTFLGAILEHVGPQQCPNMLPQNHQLKQGRIFEVSRDVLGGVALRKFGFAIRISPGNRISRGNTYGKRIMAFAIHISPGNAFPGEIRMAKGIWRNVVGELGPRRLRETTGLI